MDSKGTSKHDIIFIAALLAPLVPMAIAKQWFLFATFIVFYLCFGLIELIALKTGERKTVSKRFWEFSKKNKTLAWVIIAFMILMWAALMWHFSIKML